MENHTVHSGRTKSAARTDKSDQAALEHYRENDSIISQSYLGMVPSTPSTNQLKPSMSASDIFWPAAIFTAPL